MTEVTSSWVARNWAATVDLAGREPVIVRHHGRLRAVIVNDILAERFLDWLAEQPAGHAAAMSGTVTRLRTIAEEYADVEEQLPDLWA